MLFAPWKCFLDASMTSLESNETAPGPISEHAGRIANLYVAQSVPWDENLRFVHKPWPILNRHFFPVNQCFGQGPLDRYEYIYIYQFQYIYIYMYLNLYIYLYMCVCLHTSDHRLLPLYNEDLHRRNDCNHSKIYTVMVSSCRSCWNEMFCITPWKINMSPRKRQFQKEMSSSNHQFSGDMLACKLGHSTYRQISRCERLIGSNTQRWRTRCVRFFHTRIKW